MRAAGLDTILIVASENTQKTQNANDQEKSLHKEGETFVLFGDSTLLSPKHEALSVDVFIPILFPTMQQKSLIFLQALK